MFSGGFRKVCEGILSVCGVNGMSAFIRVWRVVQGSAIPIVVRDRIHSVADYNSTLMGVVVVVVVVVVVRIFHDGITRERLELSS